MAIPVICPPQNVPPSDEGSNLFVKAWWLFFKNLAASLNKIEKLTAAASASLTLSNSMADIPGQAVTLDQAGDWFITATVTFTADPASLGVQAQLAVAGIAFGAVMQSDVVGTYTLTRSWKYTNTGNNNVAKIQAKKNAGAGVSTAYSGSSDIIAIFLG